MKQKFEVGDCVQRINDSEVGTVTIVDASRVVVEFDRGKLILQRFLPIADSEFAWDEAGVRTDWRGDA
jgi:hypothetical protein